MKRLKAKYIAAAAVLSFVVASALLIWAGISAVNFAQNQVHAIRLQGPVETLGAQLSSLPALTTAGCWSEVQNLMKVELWLTKPPAENLNLLTAACLKGPTERKQEYDPN